LGESQAAVDFYRSQNSAICNYWQQAKNMYRHLANGVGAIQWGPLQIERGCITGPNGLRLPYKIKWSTYEHPEKGTTTGWMRASHGGYVGTWYGDLVQNDMEFLCRIDLAHNMYEIRVAQPETKIALCTHDEIVTVLPDDGEAEDKLEKIKEIMCTPPAWMPDIPLAVEGHLSEIYNK
jgi:hypothetical protein